MKKKLLAGLLCIVLTLLASPLVQAAGDYPERPVTMLVAFSPGGGTDVAARGIARYIEKYLGEGAKIAVVNKPGAGGEIGFTTLANAKPDGYTIGFINVPAIAAYTVERQTKYKMSDFRTLGNIVYDPGVWAVRADSQFKTLTDVIEYGKKNPGVLTIGTTGSSGSSEHIAIMQIERLNGAKFNHAPFGSTAPMRSALLGGHIPLGAFNLGEGVALEAEGKIRFLGTMGEERAALAPHVPTFKEQGVDVISGSSRGLAAPKAIPDELFKQLETAVEKAVNDPAYVANAKKAFVPLAYLSGAQYQALIDRLEKDLRALWAEAPWK